MILRQALVLRLRWTLSLVALLPPVEAFAQTCPPGQIADSDTRGHCCWPDQVWAVSRGRCVGIPTCPSGFVARGENCELERATPPARAADPLPPPSASAEGSGPDQTPPIQEIPSPPDISQNAETNPESTSTFSGAPQDDTAIEVNQPPSSPSSPAAGILTRLPTLVRFDRFEGSGASLEMRSGDFRCRLPCWRVFPTQSTNTVTIRDREGGYELRHSFNVATNEAVLIRALPGGSPFAYMIPGLLLIGPGLAAGILGSLGTFGELADYNGAHAGPIALTVGGFAAAVTGLILTIVGVSTPFQRVEEVHTPLRIL